MNKKTIDNRGFLWTIIVLCFALAVLDMIFLKEVLLEYKMVTEDWQASLIAFALATAANSSALVWGMQVGQRKSGRSFLAGWILLGFVYLVLRGMAISKVVQGFGDGLTENEQISAIASQLIKIVILSISYIGTGTMIKWAAEQLWDADTERYRKAKATFELENRRIAKNGAVIDGMIKTLEEYGDNYRSLGKQYDNIKSNINEIERSTMAQIVERTIAEHSDIDPVDAREVMNIVLEEREKENEKHHSQA